MPKLGEKQFYCVKCRKAVTVKAGDMCAKVYANKRAGLTPTLKGQCAVCQTTLTKFIARDATEDMTSKYGKC